MKQAKFTLEETHIEFLKNFQFYGFKDKSTLVRIALEHLKEELVRKELRKSAELYAVMYEEEVETQELTEAAISGWPE